ncbi:hypothetical protein BS47DRAFT_1355370 [Hydnum rufescens UP504]|uniref:BZIP domain-containing protein n=1 Tax=Hydnum rufescens UP504 TaxID=1448309 RepID=A0A9P6AFL4_9AGAM|nr:hypothetical protein BS47DRAFT_1355370 [Hydnum rufescens UP504]
MAISSIVCAPEGHMVLSSSPPPIRGSFVPTMQSPPPRIVSSSPPMKKRRLSPPIEVERLDAADKGGSEDSDQNRKHWKAPTGHRRGITVKEMLPLTAPTQSRRSSSTPLHSQTLATPAPGREPNSKGDYMASRGRTRRSRSSASVDSEDGNADDGDESGTGVRVEEDPAAAKRRQNTVAARRSRQRKLEHVRNLESKVQELTGERDELKVKCSRLEDRVAFLKEMIVNGKAGSRGDDMDMS